MRVKKLALTNFRSYKSLELELAPGPTTFIGNNGSGKTNIAESLIYLAYLSSHRVSQNLPLLHLGTDQAIIRAEIERDDRTLQVDLEINASKANRARLNQNATKSQRDILGALQVIYFSPEDLDLVRGEPTHRRDFLDKLLITRAPRLAGVISDYDRVVKQRNTLLKTRAPENALAPWTEQLINLGAQLSAERIALVEELNPYVAANYANLNEVKPASIAYKSATDGLTTNTDENIQTLTARQLEVARQETERGASLIGPHRDDLHLQLGDFPAKGYASHGESWSMAISLRVGAFNLLKSEGAEPILILDDIFAELDTARRAQLTSVTKMAEQTIITAAVESDLPPELLSSKYYVSPGVVSKERATNV
ncbi:DNA replication/repair protein RecF [Candidatus Planktophila lacus]|uniref:DNA replication and repair protein RecF n=1 Tax=Candidatus Planktophila lacus TaxID=1884913 RepID=A0AAD0E2J6_9ACTN|nr:DNA replication/repair protein RecF [Candidatus Planktophila lacus]ASY09979.1 DNA replication and repair protein RecF [Candidatus Planktophila lacus]